MECWKFVYSRFTSDSIKRTIKIYVRFSGSAGGQDGRPVAPNQQENTLLIIGLCILLSVYQSIIISFYAFYITFLFHFTFLEFAVLVLLVYVA
jgi:hypothetical protein